MPYGLIIITLCGAILCLAAAWIMHIRQKRGIDATVTTAEQKKDFIDKAIQRLDNRLGQYGGKMSVSTYLGIAVLGYTVVCLFLMLYGQPLPVSCLLAIVGFYAPEMVLKVYVGRQKKLFEDRYARALQQFASSLRSGLTVQQAVTDICACPYIHESIRSSYRQIETDLRVGISVKNAFLRAAKKLNSVDAMDVAIAISLQHELGGSQAKVIEAIARNISSRILLRREIKSLFADTSITIVMMDVVPLCIIVALVLGSPQYLAPFFASPVMTMLFIGIVAFMLVGSVVIRKVVKKGTEG